MSALAGGCHCGNITVVFETLTGPGALALRTCQCTFCRKHGARNASDPRGRLTVTVREGEGAPRYRFGLGVTDFLVCQSCGVYVVATMETERGLVGTINVNVLDDQGSLPSTAEPMVFDGEDADSRTARRLRGWTPATIRPARR
jgi:hypothetical protein